MENVSAAFTDAIASGDHNVVVRAEILSQGEVVLATDATSGSGLHIIDGNVTREKSADYRSHSTLKLVDPSFDLVPTDALSLLTPWGNEMRIYRGIEFADGTSESVLLCTDRISTVTVDESSGGATITLTGFSRERQVARNVPVATWPTATVFGYPVPATPYTTYARTIISNFYPQALFDATAATWLLFQNDSSVTTINTNPPWLQAGSDPWKQAKNMADAVGCDLFAKRDGTFSLIRDPNLILMSADTPLAPVATFIEGKTATFLSLKRTLSDEKTWNQIIVNGEGNNFSVPLRSAPPYGTIAVDNDPNSPTNVTTSYGIVTHVETNSLMRTQTQVDNYAQLLLRRTIGGQEIVELPVIVNPALDVDDAISITRERDGVADTTYVIDSVSIPLRAEASMTIKTRERKALH